MNANGALLDRMRFNESNFVVLGEASTPQQELLVFLPGTNGKSRNGVLEWGLGPA